MPVALITGASTGIGRATALRLAKNGWTALAGVRDPAAGESLLAEAPSAGRVVALTLDVTDAEQIARAAQRVDEETAQAGQPGSGRLDALVNNAGIGIGGPLEIIPLDEVRRQFEVNVFGQIAVTQALLPALRRARGRVVFVSSIGGRVAVAFTAPYAASKHAVEAIGDALRVELHSSNVQVALIEMASVATPIWGKAQADSERVNIPPELEPVYGPALTGMEKAMSDAARSGIPAEQLAETIEGALTSPRMKARYLVGRRAKGMLLAKRLLPDHVFDRVIRRNLGA
jgi:NAD(P)-dependent dehydrogenase (short-subunit alcohol dehydrogenase family)